MMAAVVAPEEPPNSTRIAVTTRALLLFNLRRVARAEESALIEVGAAPDMFRMYVFRGFVAWAHDDRRRLFLSDVIAQEAGIQIETLREIVKECTSRGQKLGEFLTSNGYLNAEMLRGCLRKHVREHVKMFLENVSLPTTVCVVRKDHRYDDRFVFGFEDAFTSESET